MVSGLCRLHAVSDGVGAQCSASSDTELKVITAVWFEQDRYCRDDEAGLPVADPSGTQGWFYCMMATRKQRHDVQTHTVFQFFSGGSSADTCGKGPPAFSYCAVGGISY